MLCLVLYIALRRRKRVAWWLAAMMLWVLWLADLGVLFTYGVYLLLEPELVASSPGVFARVAFNVVPLGLIIATMTVYRGEFAAVRSPGNFRKAMVIAVVGMVLVFGIGYLLLTFNHSYRETPPGRMLWILQRFMGTPPAGPPAWIATVVGLLAGLVIVAALLVLLRSQRQAAFMSEDDEVRVRALVSQSVDDSLAYFATRRDKSVVFAGSGKSAITYRATLGVCLAGSDPLGPRDHWEPAIDAWLDLSHRRGWMPAVIGASEAGATAYAAAGLRVIRLGDEAVLYPGQFHLDGRGLRPVRQAVQRLEKLGYRTRIRRHRDIDPAEMQALVELSDAWRDTNAERGFSMALGRLGNPGDGDCLMVEAIFGSERQVLGGSVAALLSFVPWGRDGYSLDLMRRHPMADNGVNELMVAHLMADRSLGIRQVSLNFAVFRSVFEDVSQLVGTQDQQQTDNALHQADGGCGAPFAGEHAVVVDVGVQDLAGPAPHRRLLQDDLLEAHREHRSKSQDQDQDDHRLDPRQRDVPQLADPGRAVNGSRFVKVRVDTGQRSEEQDRSPPGVLPDDLEHQQQLEHVRVADQVGTPGALLQHHVREWPTIAQDHLKHRDHHHPRHEVRQVEHALH